MTHRNHGYGLIAFLFTLLGLGLGAAGISLTARFLLDERAIAETRGKMRRLAFAIARDQFSTRTQGQRQYESDVGALPSALSDLLTKPGPVAACSLDSATQSLSGWCGPYVERVFTGENTFFDGWGSALVLSTSPRQIKSLGPNRADNGGAGDDLVQGY